MWEAYLTPARLQVLKDADAIVREFCAETGWEDKVWQCPVVLVPIGSSDARDSVVLRPVGSIDGMTADAALMEPALLERLTDRLLHIRALSAVFYDVTNKPPGTIEWE
jgi:GMP synthase (glutamine-hydrolysing)